MMDTTTNNTAGADLVDRYLYAVTRHLPRTERDEVSRELDSLIDEMIAERCGPITPTEKDVRVVLTELGAPQEVALQYSGQPDQALISGVYYLTYKRILRIVLPIVAIALPAALLLSFLGDDPVVAFTGNASLFIGQLFGQVFGAALSGVIQAFAIITIIFAVIQRSRLDVRELNQGLDDGASDFLSSLPEPPQKSEAIKPAEPIIGIILTLAFLVFILAVPWIAGAWFEGVGWIPVLNTAAVRSLWLPIVIWTFMGVLKEIVRLVEGRHTWIVALATLVANIVIMGCILFMVLGGNLINPAFYHQMEIVLAAQEGGVFVLDLLRSVNVLFLAVVLVGLIIDSITVMVKAIRYDSGRLSDTFANLKR
jgi:hypothetical protein